MNNNLNSKVLDVSLHHEQQFKFNVLDVSNVNSKIPLIYIFQLLSNNVDLQKGSQSSFPPLFPWQCWLEFAISTNSKVLDVSLHHEQQFKFNVLDVSLHQEQQFKLSTRCKCIS
jgi:hypothetical protein